jgi:hypothetical protein
VVDIEMERSFGTLRPTVSSQIVYFRFANYKIVTMVDFCMWDHIEVSDDEDDTHPNIDTPSLFKWRHEARVQRLEEMKGKTDADDAEKKRVEVEGS